MNIKHAIMPAYAASFMGMQFDDAEWSDIDESDESDNDNKLFSRKRSSWQDIIKKENNTKLINPVKKKNKNIENDTNECAICFDVFIKKDACFTTHCGHKFHSNCLFKNFEHRQECPLCRSELIKQKEPEEDDDYDNEDDEDEETEQLVSIKQLADKLITFVYTMEDVLMLYFGGSNHLKDISNPRWKEDLAINNDNVESIDTKKIGSHYVEHNSYYNCVNPEPKGIIDRLQFDIDYILEGKIAVKYTDNRTYAQVLASK